LAQVVSALPVNSAWQMAPTLVLLVLCLGGASASNDHGKGREPVLAQEDCVTYFKVQGEHCGELCLGEMVGVCPRSMVAYMGGVKPGTCKDAGYTVHIGEESKLAGPCGTLTVKSWDKPGEPVHRAHDECQPYRKTKGDHCRDLCLAERLGMCPRSMVVFMRGAKPGTCEDAGYTVYKGTEEEKVGLCGTLTAKSWDKPGSDDDCEMYMKTEGAHCGDLCLGAMVGICPRSMVAYMGGVKPGSCKDAGYTVYMGEESKFAGPCGTLTAKSWDKPGEPVIRAQDKPDLVVV